MASGDGLGGLALEHCEGHQPNGLTGLQARGFLLSGPPATAFRLSPNRYSSFQTDSMYLPCLTSDNLSKFLQSVLRHTRTGSTTGGWTWRTWSIASDFRSGAVQEFHFRRQSFPEKLTSSNTRPKLSAGLWIIRSA
jgi:hypothetical protein